MVTVTGTRPKQMSDPAVHSLEYMNNFMLLGCLIGFWGTVNLSKLIHAWVFFQDQAVASTFIVEQRKKVPVTVDKATGLTTGVPGLLSSIPHRCAGIPRTWAAGNLRALSTLPAATTDIATLEEKTISVLFKAKSKCKLGSSVEVKTMMG